MQSGLKAMLASAGILVLVAGGEFLYLRHERAVEAATPMPVASTPEAHVDPDTLVRLKREQPTTFADAKKLKGRTLWVDAGGQLDYFKVNGHSIDLDHSEGTLAGADPLLIQDAVQQPVPAKIVLRMPRGDRQVFLLFTRPGNPQVYAAPVGFEKDGKYTYSTDDIFFYDDPRKLYSDWGPQVWAAIDAHKVIPGMSERQAGLSLGQLFTPTGRSEGDRTLDFYNNGHDVTVTFVGNKATKIEGPAS